MAKVTGIGGVFLRCKGDSKALAAWCQEHLGIPLESWGGAVLRWPDGIAVVDGPQSHENGKFAWVMDPDGNKVELWEPMAWDEKNKP